MNTVKQLLIGVMHGLRTPIEGINKRNLKLGPTWQTKYASDVSKNFGVGVDFRPNSEGMFPAVNNVLLELA